jgi:hypothetical protein
MRIAEKYTACQLLYWYRSNELWKKGWAGAAERSRASQEPPLLVWATRVHRWALRPGNSPSIQDRSCPEHSRTNGCNHNWSALAPWLLRPNVQCHAQSNSTGRRSKVAVHLRNQGDFIGWYSCSSKQCLNQPRIGLVKCKSANSVACHARCSLKIVNDSLHSIDRRAPRLHHQNQVRWNRWQQVAPARRMRMCHCNSRLKHEPST